MRPAPSEEIMAAALLLSIALPDVRDLTLMYAQYLLQDLVEDSTQPDARRVEAALLVFGIAHDQEMLGKDGDLAPLFEYGGRTVIAGMLVDAFKARWPTGTCTGTVMERDFMPFIFDHALAVLASSTTRSEM